MKRTLIGVVVAALVACGGEVETRHLRVPLEVRTDASPYLRCDREAGDRHGDWHCTILKGDSVYLGEFSARFPGDVLWQLTVEPVTARIDSLDWVRVNYGAIPRETAPHPDTVKFEGKTAPGMESTEVNDTLWVTDTVTYWAGGDPPREGFAEWCRGWASPIYAPGSNTVTACIFHWVIASGEYVADTIHRPADTPTEETP